MIHLVMIFSLIAAAVAQAVTPAWTPLGRAKLPLILGVVLYYALTRDRNTMLRAAFLGGLFQDALGMMPLGTSSFCFCLVAAVINRFRELIFVRQFTTHLLFGALVNLATTLALFLLLVAGGHVAAAPRLLVMKLAGAVALGALAMPPVFYAVETLERRVGVLNAREF